MKNPYLTKLCYIDYLRCETELWLGSTGLWMHRQALGQPGVMRRPGAKTELGPHMGLGDASYANVIKGAFV